MATQREPVGAPEALEPELEELLARKGLTQEALGDAECFYASDVGDNLVAEYPSRWQRSRVPGRPLSMEAGESSMRDGARALVVTW
jgi:ParB-like chromosome segregation protein Spo0J